MNDSLEFKRLIPWLRAVGALIAALLICVQETASAAVLFQIMCVSPRGSGANEGWRQPCQSSQTRRGGGAGGGGGLEMSDRILHWRGRSSRSRIRRRGVKCIIATINCWVIGAADILRWCAIIMSECVSNLWISFIFFPFFPPQSCERLPPRFILSSNDNIRLTYLIPQYVHMKTGVRRAGWRCKKNNAEMKTLCLAELLIAWVPFSRQISPRGWLNTIAVPSSKSQVCAAKHATRQWKLAAWMMVITPATEAANASFQEGAVWWASLMSAQEQEFIYLL